MDGLLGARIKSERDRRGWSQKRLATEVTRQGFAIGQSAIGNIESNRTEKPRCIVELGLALGVSSRWLLTGKGERRAPPDERKSDNIGARKSQSDVTSAITGGLQLLLFRTVAAHGSEHGEFQLQARRVGEVSRPEHLAYNDRAFAMRIVSNANAPVYNLGDIISVNPEEPVMIGYDYAFASAEHMNDDGADAVIGHLVRETKTTWVIFQYAAMDQHFEVAKDAFPDALRVVNREHRR